MAAGYTTDEVPTCRVGLFFKKKKLFGNLQKPVEKIISEHIRNNKQEKREGELFKAKSDNMYYAKYVNNHSHFSALNSSSPFSLC